MKDIAYLLRAALIMAIAGAFVFLCIVGVRSILQRLLSPRLIRMHEAIKPLFDPSSGPTQLESSFWLSMCTATLVILTIVVAVSMCDVLDAFWELVRAM